MGPGPERSARPTWWRPVLTVAAFSALPFAVFLNDNRAETELDLAIALYALTVFALGLSTVVLCGRLWGASARESGAVAFAAAAFVFFHFDVAQWIAERAGFSAGAAVPTLVAWLLVVVAALAIAMRASREPFAWSYVMVAGILLTAVPIVQFAHFKVTEADAAGASSSTFHGAGEAPAALARSPDVYFFLLDGYGRADQLKATVGYDNSRFLRSLGRRGFAVHDRATAAYPVTFLSLASTLDMGYPALPGDLKDYTPFFDAVEGENLTVSTFHELGYHFAFGSDYSALDCGEPVDLCIEPERTRVEELIGEREHALLRATPLTEILPAVGIHPSPLSGRLSPQEIVEAVAREDSDQPVFAYGHILAPHPPYRYVKGCELKPDIRDPSLIYWGERDGGGGAGYRQAAECVNRSLLAAVDAILAEEPGAIIVIQGDHGPKFDIDFHRPLSDWSPAELQQRFPILNAQRLPEDCAPSGPRAELTVNTFRYVLACITGREADPLPPRRFMIDLEAGRIERVDSPPPTE
jgi:hypothetical protein